jgi:hypothetical protein
LLQLQVLLLVFVFVFLLLLRSPWFSRFPAALYSPPLVFTGKQEPTLCIPAALYSPAWVWLCYKGLALLPFAAAFGFPAAALLCSALLKGKLAEPYPKGWLCYCCKGWLFPFGLWFSLLCSSSRKTEYKGLALLLLLQGETRRPLLEYFLLFDSRHK